MPRLPHPPFTTRRGGHAARALLAASLLAAPPLAQDQPLYGELPLQNAADIFDDVQGSWVLYETHPIQPMLMGPIGAYLFVLNQEAMRLTTFYTPNHVPVSQVFAGPGLVSIVGRPGTYELWMVDQVTSTVSVVDIFHESIVRSIRVGGEPHGIVFHPELDRAYVACSGAKRVDVIDASTYSVVQEIEVDALAPRGIAYADGAIWVSPLLSGNNTASHEIGNDPASAVVLPVDPNVVPGALPLPDRDVICIEPHPSDPTQDAINEERTVSGVGTLLANVHAHPERPELWIPNTEALNGVFRGEVNFPAGQVVENRVTVVHVQTGAKTIVDLDQYASQGIHCSTPTGIAFWKDYAFVCGYGSDSVAVIDVTSTPPSFVGSYDVDPLGDGRAGPRTAVVDEINELLYVYNKADHSYSEFALTASPTFGMKGEVRVSLGYDPTPDAVRRGRGQSIRTDNSLSGTSSCNSCHFDGHLDGLAWDLSEWSDPEGTHSFGLTFEVDRKGPMATQSLRGLPEMAPYHWRGERATLADFNPAFPGLLERTRQGELEPLSADELADFSAYVFQLVYGPNPRQELDRGFTADQQAGLDAYKLACAACHEFPLGTNGELMRDAPQFLSRSTQVTHLRGVEDKLHGEVELNDSFPFGTRSAIGFGLAHSPIISTLDEFLLGFNLPQDTRDRVVDYTRVFDNGHAPSAGFQATATAENASEFEANELAFLLEQAQAGHCGILVHGFYYDDGFEGNPAGAVPVSCAYDHQTGAFQFASSLGDQLSPSELMHLVADGQGTVTFFGVARGLAWRWALDWDNDGLLNQDEWVHGANPELHDTDGDGFSDGHEVRWGMTIGDAEASSPDGEAPSIVEGPLVLYATTNTIKLGFRTSEPVRAKAAPNGVPGQTPFSPSIGGYDVNHVIVVDQLPENTDNDLEIVLTDEAGNTSIVHFLGRTLGHVAPSVIVVDAIGAGLQQSLQANSIVAELELQIDLRRLQGGPATDQDFEVELFVYQSVDGGPMQVVSQAELVKSEQSVASTTLVLDPIPAPAGGGLPERTIHVGVRDVESLADPELVLPMLYVEAHDVTNYEVFTLQ